MEIGNHGVQSAKATLFRTTNFYGPGGNGVSIPTADDTLLTA